MSFCEAPDSSGGFPSRLPPCAISVLNELMKAQPSLVELARVGEVLHVGRQLDRERLLGHDAALGAVELPELIAPRYFSLYSLDRRVAAAERRRVLRALDHVVGVRA